MRRAAAALLATLGACSRPPHTEAGAAPPAATTPTTAVRAATTPAATPAPAAPAARVDLMAVAVPPFDAATVAHVRTLYGAASRAGSHLDVFAKIGDSITESGSFAHDIGHGWTELGEYARLEPVIRHFTRRAFSSDAEDNSFTRPSAAATAGWTTEDLLAGGDACPVERELRALRPAFAVVMIGTNDTERVALPEYERNLREVLRRVEARNVVAVLSTIPDHRGTPAFTARSREVNAVIARVARELHLPLLDYHAALAPLPNAGLCEDNIHPSAFVENGDTRAGVFTPAGLRHGYNVRNLTWLLMLERLVETVGARG
ncbi:MAG: SGNH/GDSL hydrolase family protein [Polyangiales bacterium]